MLCSSGALCGREVGEKGNSKEREGGRERTAARPSQEIAQ